jgi:hypothetical protein
MFVSNELVLIVVTALALVAICAPTSSPSWCW